MAIATPAANAAGTTLVLDAQENYYLPTEDEGPNLDLGITASGGDAYPDVTVSRHPALRDRGVNDPADCASWMRSWQASQAATVMPHQSSMTRAQSDGGCLALKAA